MSTSINGQFQGRDTVVTPEAVALELDTAGAGSRMVAALVDALLQFGLLLIVGIALAGLGLMGVEGWVIATVAVAALFIVLWGYYIFFEITWRGSTPGKKRMGLKVVGTNGQPITWVQAVVRNLLRIVDFLPSSYGLGVVLVLVTPRSQRLGDLAAGTVVMRERKAPPPVEIVFSRPTGEESGLDAAGLSHRDYELVRSFLMRRESLDVGPRRKVAAQLSGRLRRITSGEAVFESDDEAFLEALVRAFRRRFEG